MTKETFSTKFRHFRNKYRHDKQLLIKSSFNIALTRVSRMNLFKICLLWNIIQIVYLKNI